MSEGSERDREVRVLDDPAAAVAAAAAALASVWERSVAERGRFTLALAGGSTPRALYRLLGEGPPGGYRNRLPWPSAHFFFGDERLVPPDHPASNFRMAREALLDRVPIEAAQVHPVPAGSGDAGSAARAYEDELHRFFVARDGAPGAADGFPSFDLVLLGMGTDGHTASLFPGSAALAEHERWVAAAWVEKLGSHRITLTLPVINHARSVIFLVVGADKRPALGAVLAASPDDGTAPPAALVRPLDGRLLWLVDRAAAP